MPTRKTTWLLAIWAVTPLGLGANVLVPDEGLAGVVLRLSGAFRRVAFRGTAVSAGGGVVLARLARAAAERGLAGLEAMAGFPSTVGGAVVMNAGSYGAEIKAVVTDVRLVERDGRRRRATMAELEPGYRQTSLRASRAIVTRVRFALAPGDRSALLARIAELNARRWIGAALRPALRRLDLPAPARPR